MCWSEIYRGGTVKLKSPGAIGKDGKCGECTAHLEPTGCKYANAGEELPCGKPKPDETICR